MFGEETWDLPSPRERGRLNAFNCGFNNSKNRTAHGGRNRGGEYGDGEYGDGEYGDGEYGDGEYGDGEYGDNSSDEDGGTSDWDVRKYGA